MSQELIIKAPEGYEIDLLNSDSTQIVFKKKVVNELEKLPKSWEELPYIDGYYINVYSRSCTINSNAIDDNKATYPTFELAQASVALAQLLMLRNAWNGNWTPNWGSAEIKYSIRYSGNMQVTATSSMASRVLTFKTELKAKAFLETFKELIETARPLL